MIKILKLTESIVILYCVIEKANFNSKLSSDHWPENHQSSFGPKLCGPTLRVKKTKKTCGAVKKYIQQKIIYLLKVVLYKNKYFWNVRYRTDIILNRLAYIKIGAKKLENSEVFLNVFEYTEILIFF